MPARCWSRYLAFLLKGSPNLTETTLIFIPTYNEHENVGPICEQILSLGIDADLIFMDDNSPDGTGRAIDNLAGNHPRVMALHRSGKLGVGSAHLEGIAYAYDHGYARLVTLDSDFTHAPSDIPRMLTALQTERAAVVTGSRFQQRDSLPGWSPMRKGLTHLGHVLTRHMLGVASDATGAFRAYDLRMISRRLFELVTESGYAFFFQSMFVMQQNGLRIVEVPIVLPARTYGHSKMSFVEVARSVGQLGKLFVARHANPGQFRLGRESIDVDPKLQDTQGWDRYWVAKTKPGEIVYDLAASIYRNTFIRSNLDRVIRLEFERGARLLHAGCGSGRVDMDLHGYVDVTAVDFSTEALSRYSRENPGVHDLRHADILALPFADASFDGAYNLGVVEHFAGHDLALVFRELTRVIRPGGKIVVFWPHKHGTSAMVLDGIHYLFNDLMKRHVRLHPPEPSRLTSKRQARQVFEAAGLDLVKYEFGPRDLFVQAIAVGQKRGNAAEPGGIVRVHPRSANSDTP